jgi:hypothetical protein
LSSAALKVLIQFLNILFDELALRYIPDRRSYGEGNYEPESARCAAGSGEKLVKAAVELLEELKRQP